MAFVASAAVAAPPSPALARSALPGASGPPGPRSTLPAAAAVLAAMSTAAASRTKGVGPKVRRAAVGRRGGVLAGLAPAAAAVWAEPAAAASRSQRRPLDPNVTAQAVEKASAQIAQIIKADANKGPTLVRLAWHSSGSYDKVSKTGGSGPGTIRFKEELAHGGNAGLDKAVAWLEPVKQSNPSISYADLYTLGGVVAIKALGGPDVPWRAGRVDSTTLSDVTPDGRLPNAANGSTQKDAGHLRDVFGRMGFNDQEIVALSGAHALGRCHADASGFVGPWTPTPTTFNNLYFKLLKNSNWEEGCIKGETCKNPQYRDAASQQFMMLPTDIALLNDPSFKKYVDLYADDQKVFFQDFSGAFSTLLELGTKNLYAVA